MDRYHETRDFPAVKGPSYLGVHLRFGTVSIRALAAHAHAALRMEGSAGAAVWLSELIWRDFYFQILANFPHVVGARPSHSFKPEYDAIKWEHGKHADKRCSRPGAKAAPATRWWTPPWHRSTRPATCTTACAWWWPAFWCKDLGIDWRWGVVLDQAQQLLVRVGLAQVVVHTQFHRMLAVLFSDTRGDHDDWQIAQRTVSTYVAGQIEAIHARHFDVGQNHSGPLFLQTLQRLQAIGSQRHPVTFALQQTLRHTTHRDGIVHHQNQRNLAGARQHRRRGSLRCIGAVGFRQHGHTGTGGTHLIAIHRSQATGL
jgi:hypothetical protein